VRIVFAGGLRSLMLYILSFQTQKRAFLRSLQTTQLGALHTAQGSSNMPYRTKNHYRSGPSFHTTLNYPTKHFLPTRWIRLLHLSITLCSSQGSSYGGTQHHLSGPRVDCQVWLPFYISGFRRLYNCESRRNIARVYRMTHGTKVASFPSELWDSARR
jgi:hypothetical protein